MVDMSAAEGYISQRLIDTVLDRAERILDEAKVKIQAEMEAKDINASGRTSQSIRVEREGTHVRLVIGGEEYRTAPLETLEVGRPGGPVPGGFRTTKAGVTDVSNTFKAILVQWAKDKGIADFGWGRATILGRRIAQEGTLRHKRPVEVYSVAVTEAADEISQSAQVVITGAVHDFLTQSI